MSEISTTVDVEASKLAVIARNHMRSNPKLSRRTAVWKSIGDHIKHERVALFRRVMAELAKLPPARPTQKDNLWKWRM